MLRRYGVPSRRSRWPRLARPPPEDRRDSRRRVGMKRGLLWTLIFAALVLVALVGAAAQGVRGTKPLLFA